MTELTTNTTTIEDGGGPFSWFTGLLSNLWNNITDPLFESLGNAAESAMEGIGNFVKEQAQWIVDGVHSFLNSAIVTVFGTGDHDGFLADIGNFFKDLNDGMQRKLTNAFIGAAEAQDLETAEAAATGNTAAAEPPAQLSLP